MRLDISFLTYEGVPILLQVLQLGLVVSCLKASLYQELEETKDRSRSSCPKVAFTGTFCDRLRLNCSITFTDTINKWQIDQECKRRAEQENVEIMNYLSAANPREVIELRVKSQGSS